MPGETGITVDALLTDVGAIPAVVQGTVSLRLAPGSYRVEWWNATTGLVMHTDVAAISPDRPLTLTVPQSGEFDIAVLIASM